MSPGGGGGGVTPAAGTAGVLPCWLGSRFAAGMGNEGCVGPGIELVTEEMLLFLPFLDQAMLLIFHEVE